MNRVIGIFIGISFLVGFSVPPKMEKKIDKEISSIFSIESFQKEVISVEETLQQELSVSFQGESFQKILVDSSVIGFFYYGYAPSKTDTFDFVVIFDSEFIVKKIKVLAYREDYGGEIGSTRWLRQFNDLNTTDAVTYGKEIKAISGATISASSMTIAVNNLLKSLEILRNKKAL